MIPVHWWALAGILGLIVAGVLILVASDPRREEETVGGRHHWLDEPDDDPYEDPLVGEAQHDPTPCTADEAGDYEMCEDRTPGRSTGRDISDLNGMD